MVQDHKVQDHIIGIGILLDLKWIEDIEFISWNVLT